MRASREQRAERLKARAEKRVENVEAKHARRFLETCESRRLRRMLGVDGREDGMRLWKASLPSKGLEGLASCLGANTWRSREAICLPSLRQSALLQSESSFPWNENRKHAGLEVEKSARKKQNTLSPVRRETSFSFTPRYGSTRGKKRSSDFVLGPGAGNQGTKSDRGIACISGIVFPGRQGNNQFYNHRENVETFAITAFRWAPSEGAWQRQLNNAGRYAAEQVLR
jgi:hypothetical protein